ncbi:hypothetical protein HYT56_03205 [Candidatus Woesearchaeota archaeon]|nr:hypothetical protein [Candidatus Woesearchaeota archaeon]
MEKKTIFWILGVVVVAVVIFNLSNFTANVAKSGTPAVKVPVLKVLNSDAAVSAGSDLVVSADNIKSSSSSKLYVYSEYESYTGISFEFGIGDCKFATAGYYGCEAGFNIPISELPNGKYFIQVKDDASGELIGNKAFFTVSDSKYQETGR